ncbi:MAG: ankyrin repeat domain-containing protein [Bacteroidota bacterium]|nr:ankyrin repeat domain-containing protein [Bacteroidota bacterium]
MKALNITILFLIITLGSSCSDSKKHLIEVDLALWKGTKGWTLAKAVRDEDSVKIKKILAKGEITVDYREPKFGQNLLSWAVLNNKIKAVRILLNCGADPNLHDTYSGTSPIVHASDVEANIEILKLILDHGGNPNDRVLKTEKTTGYQSDETPLTAAASISFEKTKLLIRYGADVNLIIEPARILNRNTPLFSAVSWKRVEIVSYLLFEKKADFKETFVINIDGDTITFAKMLRKWDFPLDSKEYKEKMRIVNYLKEHGQDYWKMPIPKEIERYYPKEYLEKY